MSRICYKKVLVHCEPGYDVQTYIFTRMLVRFGCFTYCKLVLWLSALISTIQDMVKGEVYWIDNHLQ